MQADITLSPTQAPIQLSSPEGFSCVSTNISNAGELLRLWVSNESQGNVVSPLFKTQTESPYTALASVTTATNTTLYELSSLTTTCPIIEKFPDGRILVSGSHCRRSNDGVLEQNAAIYSDDGQLAKRFCLGDGIEHIQIDDLGRIWVGYSDEGVFGNRGWGAHPIGATGLECFGVDGQELWSFAPPPGFDTMADLYALNVAGNEVWTSYYTDFPIVLIDSDLSVRGWQTELSGVRALAVAGKHVLAYGGYNESRDSCQLLRLGDNNANVINDVKLSMPADLDILASKVIGRGNILHVICNQEWHQFKVPLRL